ncbi:unnamed protein product [Triticum turgidum subsp. durum]|uniref:Uncharacterized protein n=1 Tax=Triticum turgidum subsp. durum TaxID=4567 RepID=A0A9R1PYL9_TRITD|nr:unnamed protein product [Triticum turgidum subsp. durum]
MRKSSAAAVARKLASDLAGKKILGLFLNRIAPELALLVLFVKQQENRGSIAMTVRKLSELLSKIEHDKAFKVPCLRSAIASPQKNVGLNVQDGAVHEAL